MKRLIPVLCTAAAMCGYFGIQASAATIEDVYRAMEETCCPESMILNVHNQYENQPHDENGMQIGTQYHTYDEWVALIREDGSGFMNTVIGEQFGLDPAALIPATEEGRAGSDVPASDAFVPSVQPEKPFSQMTLEEMKAYTDSLPEDERVQFLANLTPEQRRSILRQLPADQKADIAAGMVEFGDTIGLNISVDHADEEDIRLLVRDAEGTLIDSAGLGLTVDPTGWDTTLPVCLAAGMLLTGGTGLYYLIKKQRDEVEQHG